MSKRKPPARRRYDTDMADARAGLIAPLIPDARAGGRPRKATSRKLVNAVLYFLRAGAAGRLLSPDLPTRQTVYYYLRRWQGEGVWQHAHRALVRADRERCGREASPSATILDSQSVRTADQKGRQGLQRGQEDHGPQAMLIIAAWEIGHQRNDAPTRLAAT